MKNFIRKVAIIILNKKYIYLFLYPLKRLHMKQLSLLMKRKNHLKTVAINILLFFLLQAQASPPCDSLRIHYINVGWGGCTLIIGPDNPDGTRGTTILYEAGENKKGIGKVVPYLKSIGIQPADGLDYVVVGHLHADHAGGMDEVINAGYNVKKKAYYNGSTYSSTTITDFKKAAASTTGGLAVMPLGTVIDLGGGAKVTCIAVNGSVLGVGPVPNGGNENDLSIGLLVQRYNFDYIIASDLGGGYADSTCTGRNTTAPLPNWQYDIESYMAKAILPGGANPLITNAGIEVMHVNHHGSESSTNSDYYNMLKPQVALISTGAGQTKGWDLPRRSVVDSVLKAKATSCVTAAPCDVYQTEEASPLGVNASTTGYCVGDIVVTTDGLTGFTVSANGAVTQGPNELAASGLPKTYPLTGDVTAPTISSIAVSNITSTSAKISWITNETTDAQIEYDTTTIYALSTPVDMTMLTNHSLDLNGLTSGKLYHYRIKSKDKAGNLTVSADSTFTTTAIPATPNVVFSEVLYDPTGDESLYEWIQLYNPGTSNINIGGWKIVDNNGCGASYTIPMGTIINAKTKFTIARSKDEFKNKWGFYPNLSNLTLGLNNDGDALLLKNGTVIIDQVAWEGGAKGASSCGVPTMWGSTTQPNAPEGQSIYRSSLITDADNYSDWKATIPILTITTLGKGDRTIPTLNQNYPNPSNTQTRIDFTIPSPSTVRLQIYNDKGLLIKTLINEYKDQGKYSVVWNNKNDSNSTVPDGTYIYELTVGTDKITKRMLVSK